MPASVPRSRPAALLGAGLLALVLAGCGSDAPAGSDYAPVADGAAASSSTAAGSSSAAAGSSSAAAGRSGSASSSQTTGRTVTATESEFAVDLSSPQLAAGTYTFTVTNAGKEALSRLSAEHRAVLEQTYYQGRTTADAAVVLGIPEGTVKTRAHYALRALRLALQEMGVVT